MLLRSAALALYIAMSPRLMTTPGVVLGHGWSVSDWLSQSNLGTWCRIGKWEVPAYSQYVPFEWECPSHCSRI